MWGSNRASKACTDSESGRGQDRWLVVGGSSFEVRGLWGVRGGRGGRLEERATSSASFGDMYVSCGDRIKRVIYHYRFFSLDCLEGFLLQCILQFYHFWSK